MNEEIIDSVGMENVKRFKQMFNIERGIWMTLAQLKELVCELETSDYKDANGNGQCSGVGFMVGVGKDMRFNVEVLPLWGEIGGNEVTGEMNYTNEYEWKSSDGVKYDTFKRTVTRHTIWKGDFLVRSINKGYKVIGYENGKPIRESYEGKKVKGLYNGKLKINHEVSDQNPEAHLNEAQRFPPPEP